MNALKNRGSGLAATLCLLAGILGLRPVEFVVFTLLFTLVIRSGRYLIPLATASEPKAKELDQT